MDKSSFRDILKQMLAAEEAALASENKTEAQPSGVHASVQPNFFWAAPPAKFSAQRGYKGAPPAQASSKPKGAPPAQPQTRKPAEPEVLIAFEKLSTADHSDLQLLIVLGANFKSGISSLRLKKEHRRLAKELHPDRISQTLKQNEKDLRREKFLILQAAYERLSRSLASLKSSGNGSASESDSPRQDAA